MAVRHLAWSFEIGQAAAAYHGLSGYSEVFAASTTAAAMQVRADPRRRPHLVMLRLDPADDGAWGPILDPDPADSGDEVAAAGRLMVLLVGACTGGEGVATASTDVQALLVAAGWPTDEAELAIRGRPLRTFFETHTPRLSELADRSRSRLTGGWLDARAVGMISANLERDQSRIEDAVVTVAAEQSSYSGLTRDWHEEHLRQGLADLDPMLRRLEDGHAWWLVED